MTGTNILVEETGEPKMKARKRKESHEDIKDRFLFFWTFAT